MDGSGCGGCSRLASHRRLAVTAILVEWGIGNRESGMGLYLVLIGVLGFRERGAVRGEE
jgi:hypothetical protein